MCVCVFFCFFFCNESAVPLLCMHMRICVCVYSCMCVCVFFFTVVFFHIDMYNRIVTYTFSHIRSHPRTYIPCRFACARVHVHACTHVRVCIRVCAYAHICTHTDMCYCVYAVFYAYVCVCFPFSHYVFYTCMCYSCCVICVCVIRVVLFVFFYTTLVYAYNVHMRAYIVQCCQRFTYAHSLFYLFC